MRERSPASRRAATVAPVHRATHPAGHPHAADRAGVVHPASPQRRHLQRARRHDRLVDQHDGVLVVDTQFADTAPNLRERPEGAQPARHRRADQLPPPSRSHRRQRRAAPDDQADRRPRARPRRTRRRRASAPRRPDAAGRDLHRHVEREGRRRDDRRPALGTGAHRWRLLHPLRAGQHRPPGRPAEQPRLPQRGRAGRRVGARLDQGPRTDGAGTTRRTRSTSTATPRPGIRSSARDRTCSTSATTSPPWSRWPRSARKEGSRATNWPRWRRCRASSTSAARSRAWAWP